MRLVVAESMVELETKRGGKAELIDQYFHVGMIGKPVVAVRVNVCRSYMLDHRIDRSEVGGGPVKFIVY